MRVCMMQVGKAILKCVPEGRYWLKGVAQKVEPTKAVKTSTADMSTCTARRV